MPWFAQELGAGRDSAPGRGGGAWPLSLLTLRCQTASLPPRPGAGSRRRVGWVSRCPEGRWHSSCAVGISICKLLWVGHVEGGKSEGK